MKTLVFAIVLLSCSAVRAASPTVLIELSSPRVVDGDTITGDINLPLSFVIKGQSVRASNYDAAESKAIRRTNGKGPSQAELKQGKQAAAELTELTAGARVYIVPTKRDNFGRVLGELWIYKGGQWIELATYAKEHGWIRK